MGAFYMNDADFTDRLLIRLSKLRMESGFLEKLFLIKKFSMNLRGRTQDWGLFFMVNLVTPLFIFENKIETLF